LFCEQSPQLIEKYYKRFKQSEACYRRKHANDSESLMLELVLNNKNEVLRNDPALLVNDDISLHT
jgi:hypothetical protein